MQCDTERLVRGDVAFDARYELLDKLSEGGFGVVFRARQRATGQLVAIKFLIERQWAPYGDAKRKARFRREMKLCAQLHHPNIVRLIDSGRVAPHDTLFTVFEFIPGQNLKELLEREQRLTPVETGYLMGQVLDALSYAHSLGIVHRDLKPANIMIIPAEVRRNALILDFGIGALIDSSGSPDYIHITASADMLGTPTYAAPEQLRGRSTNAASDLYSWGLVYLECLTGQRVVRANSTPAIVAEQLNAKPIALPSWMQGHRLADILRLVLDKDVDRRSQIHASMILRQLDACALDNLSAPPIVPQGGVATTAAQKQPTQKQPTQKQSPQKQSTQKQSTQKQQAQKQQAQKQPTQKQPAQKQQVQTQQSHAHQQQAGANGTHPRTPRAAQETVTATSAKRPAGAHNDERRQLTAVCCGFRIAPEGLDQTASAEQDAALYAQHELCIAVGRRCGGHLAGVLGHRVMFYFGYPKAHADDVRRAALASLAIVETCAAQTPRLQHGAALEVQVGIHTGLVVVPTTASGTTANAFAVRGTTPTTAIRLSDMVPPRAIWVSESTHRIIGDQFRFDLPTQQQLSDRDRMIAVHWLREPLPAEGLLADSFRGRESPLVGRTEEVALLQQRWALARSGQGQFVLITGEAGIGKSRLLWELNRLGIADRGIWLDGRSDRDDCTSTLQPIVAILKHLLGSQRADAAQTSAKLEALLNQYDLDLEAAMPLFAELLSLPLDARFAVLNVSPQRHRDLMLSAVLSLILEMAARAPLLLVLEDLHWADPMTLEFLSLLLEEVPTAPILLVLTARPDFAPPWRASDVTMIQLVRLDEAEVRTIIDRVADEHQLSTAVIEHIVQRSDGVPRFVEELTRSMVTLAAEAQWQEQTSFIDSHAELAIPTSLRDALMARLDRLGPAKTTAQLAAAIGREFSYELLRAVSTLATPVLQTAVKRLVSADLVHRRRRIRGDVYTFKHALIRDTAYESLPKSIRRQYHHQIAAAIAQQFSKIAAAHPELLAHHHAGAEEYTAALKHAKRASSAALRRSAYADAIRYAEQSLLWVRKLPDGWDRHVLELDVNSILSAALYARYGYSWDGLEAVYQRYHVLVERMGDSAQTFAALVALHVYYLTGGHQERARALGEQSMRLAERLGDHSMQSTALGLLGNLHFLHGELASANTAFTQAIKQYDPADNRGHTTAIGTDIKVLAHTSLGIVLWLQGYPDTALRHSADGLAWAMAIQHPPSIASALLYVGGLQQYRGERAEVRSVAAELGTIANRYDLALAAAFGELLRCWADTDVAAAKSALRDLQALDAFLGVSYWSAIIAQAEADVGDLGAAIARLDECLQIAETTGERHYLSEIYRLKGEYLLAWERGDDDAGQKCLRQAIDVATTQGAKLPELRATVALGRVLRNQGRDREANDAVRAIYDWFTEGQTSPEMHAARAFLGL